MTELNLTEPTVYRDFCFLFVFFLMIAILTDGEITPERMKGWNQSKNNTQLWILLVIEARSDAVKSNIA